MVGVEQGLTLQQHAGNPEQTVGDAAQGPARGVAPRPQGLIAAAAGAVDLHGDAGPVEHRLAQPDLGGIPHDDNPRLATSCHVLPLRLVTGATPDRVLRAASSRRASGPAASVSRVASVTGPTPGSERRMAASPGPLSWAAESVSLRAVQSSSSLRAA